MQSASYGPASPVLKRLSSLFAPLTASLSDPVTSQAGFAAQRSDEDRTGLNPRSAIFRKLLAGIIYSRNFVLTYYVVAAIIVFAFVLGHWIPRAVRWYKRRAADRKVLSYSVTTDGIGADGLQKYYAVTDSRNYGHSETDATGSGSSSPTLVPERSDEDSPLLGNKVESTKATGSATIAFRKFSSWLTYQPRSLPGFHNRVMPSNGTTVLMLVFLAINSFYLLFNIEFSVNMIFVFADRAGVLFVTNLPILYILSAKNQPLQPFIGYSYATLNIAHRRLGEWMCLLAAIHAIGMFVVWATLLRPGGYEFVRFITDRVVILGLGALVCYEAIYFTSLATMRQMAYELFLATHIFLQIGSLAFLYFHHSKSRVYVLISLGIWAIDRIAYRLCLKSSPSKAALTVLPDGQTIGVSISIPIRKLNPLRKVLGAKNVRDGWQNLDHIFLSIPELGSAHALQSHPFSIASAAPSADMQSADLELIIRARDGFSKNLLAYAQEHYTVNVRMDGPYGSQSACRLLEDSDARVIIAGGSGIAVTQPLLEQLLADEEITISDIEWAAHDKPARPILFVWVVHKSQQWHWVDLPRLRALSSKAGVEFVLPEPTEQFGRPDLNAIIATCIQSQRISQRVGVVVSGPDGMSREVRNGCAALQAKGHNVCVEVEKYGW